MKTPSNPGLRRAYINLKKANWDRYRQEAEPIPTGRHRLHEEPVPADILQVMNRRDDLRKRDLPRLNKEIQNRICVHKRTIWRDYVETMDQMIYLTMLWRTIKGINGRTKCEAENEAITFNGSLFSSSKQLATKFTNSSILPSWADTLLQAKPE